jgi:hypothetical protein
VHGLEQGAPVTFCVLKPRSRGPEAGSATSPDVIGLGAYVAFAETK